MTDKERPAISLLESKLHQEKPLCRRFRLSLHMTWLTWFPYRILTLYRCIVCCNRAQKQSVVDFCFVLSCNLWLIFAGRRIVRLCAGVNCLSTAIIFFHLQGVVCSTKIARSLLTIIVFSCCFLHWNHIQSNSHLIGCCWCMSFGSYIWLCFVLRGEAQAVPAVFLFVSCSCVGRASWNVVWLSLFVRAELRISVTVFYFIPPSLALWR